MTRASQLHKRLFATSDHESWHRDDARVIAQLMRLMPPVHCKSMAAQEVRALLTARKLVQSRLYDIEMSLRGHSARAKNVAQLCSP